MTTMRRELAQLIPLALPLILAQLAQNGMSFIDTLMVGRLGNAALAGIALGSTVLGLVYLVLGGVVLAVGPVVSQAHGARAPEAAARAVRQGLLLGTLLFVPAMLLFWLSEPALLALGQTPATARLASGYLRAVGWGLLPGFWWLALRGLLEGHGVTRPIMLISFAGVLLNVLLNNALRFGQARGRVSKWLFFRAFFPYHLNHETKFSVVLSFFIFSNHFTFGADQAG